MDRDKLRDLAMRVGKFTAENTGMITESGKFRWYHPLVQVSLLASATTFVASQFYHEIIPDIIEGLERELGGWPLER
jgi:hypothetical protein